MTNLHPIVLSDMESIANSELDWGLFAGKRVLITGAAGFLPAYIVHSLLYINDSRGLNCRVVGVVRNLVKAREKFMVYAGRADFSLVEGDVGAPLPAIEKCDFIIHAASQASPKFYGSDPVGTMSANLFGTSQLLELSRRWGSNFLFFSSGEVYGQVPESKIPTREIDYGYIDILNSRSCYAESKRAGETLCVSYCKQFNVDARIIRPFHTYGPGMALDDGRVFADFVSDVVNRRNLVLRSDGSAIRAFCYLSDAVRGFFTVMLKGESGAAYNVGNPEGAISIRELAELLSSLFPDLGLKVIRSYDSGQNYMPSPISRNIPDVTSLNALGWSPEYSVSCGFERTVKSFF